ncbi:MAG: hypothetical protein IKD28_05090 [Clostridia bacterium]|nr:hypothetical protein [Clostridia bacterium]
MSTVVELSPKLSVDMPQPRVVLFVCTGNTCRSPMAAAVWNHLAAERGWHSIATSAGLYVAVGMPISKEAVAALSAAGIMPTPRNDYPSHTARPVSEKLMQNADRVIAISATHAMELAVRYPQYAAKIETMPQGISDPFGGDVARYCACLEDIRQGIGQLCEGEQ